MLCKFDQHRPHFKVLSNQYASVFLRYCRFLLPSASKSKDLFKIPNSQLFSYSRKEHTDSKCYFYVNHRARIAYSEYRIAYSEYRIAYTVYFYVNAALATLQPLLQRQCLNHKVGASYPVL